MFAKVAKVVVTIKFAPTFGTFFTKMFSFLVFDASF